MELWQRIMKKGTGIGDSLKPDRPIEREFIRKGSLPEVEILTAIMILLVDTNFLRA